MALMHMHIEASSMGNFFLLYCQYNVIYARVTMADLTIVVVDSNLQKETKNK